MIGIWPRLYIGGLIIFLGLTGCSHHLGHRYFAGPLKPAPDTHQAQRMQVSDDGTVTFVKDRLEISLRPMTDDEMNRQFASSSQGGAQSINPYTYGNWKPWGETRPPSRFTVFLLKVKNYEYPKVQVDPLKVKITARNGRWYWAKSLIDLEQYYSPYLVAWSGNNFDQYGNRIDILRSTIYPGNVVFSGQEEEGYLVFPLLDHDVDDFSVHLQRVVLRFDYRNEPIETTDLAYHFQREIYRARQPKVER